MLDHEQDLYDLTLVYLAMSTSTPFNKCHPKGFHEPRQFCSIYSFRKYLFNTCLLPAIVLGVGTTARERV